MNKFAPGYYTGVVEIRELVTNKIGGHARAVLRLETSVHESGCRLLWETVVQQVWREPGEPHTTKMARFHS